MWPLNLKKNKKIVEMVRGIDNKWRREMRTNRG